MSALADLAAAVDRAEPASAEDEELLAEAHDLLTGERLLGVGEVAEILGVSSPTTVRNWLEQGVFPGVQTTKGGHRRFRMQDVIAVKQRMALTKAENEARSFEIPDYGDEDPYARR